jgi:transcriptional regulator with XRE-family HTH domain
MEKQELKEGRKRIGERFRQIREDYGWSVEQVATMADLKPATIEKIEAGVFNVPLDVLCRVADVLGSQLTVELNEE